MADTFTVFGKFGDVCEALEEDDRKELIYAINMYGMFGEEVKLPYMLKALFISLKEDIDNSKEARAQGSKGAKKRWNKKNDDNAKAANSTPSDKCDSPLSDEFIGGYSEKSKNPDSQTNTNQTNTNQSKPKKGGRFTPPTIDEVRAHCVEKGYTFDPEAFYAFYESKGWKVGRNPMKSWVAACVTWQKRQEGEVKQSAGDVYSQL